MIELVKLLLADKQFMSVLDKAAAPSIAVAGVLGAAAIAFVGTYYKAKVDERLAKETLALQKELLATKQKIDKDAASEAAAVASRHLKEKASVDREMAIRATLAELWPPVSAGLYHVVARTRAYGLASAADAVKAKKKTAIDAAISAKEAFGSLRPHLPELSSAVAEIARLPHCMDHQRGDKQRRDELVDAATQLRTRLDLLMANCLRAGRQPDTSELEAIEALRTRLYSFWDTPGQARDSLTGK
jgi:hypothetical protein